jgi:hypothetical protein
MFFFSPPYNKAEIETRYKELAKIMHPDRGGTKELMQKLNEEKLKALDLITKGNPKRIRMVRGNPIQKVSVIKLNIDPKKASEFLKEFRKIFR